jgi:alpha-1,4-glucan:alpha-1,4-glucan 6-glycosyltransferase
MAKTPEPEPLPRSFSARLDVRDETANAIRREDSGSEGKAGAAKSPRAPMPLDLAPRDLQRLVELRHDDPHRVLGPHRAPEDGSITIRAFVPTAARLLLRPLQPPGMPLPMQRIDPAGLFVAVVADPGADFSYELLVVDAEGRQRAMRDAYAFDRLAFGDADAALFAAGRHTRLYTKLGAHPTRLQQVSGVRFAVWAPGAERVSVVGDFNAWDGRCHPMRRFGQSGVWEVFVPGAGEGDFYKFEIRAPGGSVFLKSDPFAFRSETPPKSASIVFDIAWGYSWLDARWMHEVRGAVSGFAVQPLDLDAASLAQYLRDGTPQRIAAEGFTHVELVSGAPGMWGSAGLFAPGEAHGRPDEWMEFIDLCHAHGLGVIVPAFQAQLPAGIDDLPWFDGTQLYERPSAEPPAGGDETSAPSFAFDKGEVRSVLLSQAAFWAEHYHADGWRADPETVELLARLRALQPALTADTQLVVRRPRSAQQPPAAEIDRLMRARHPDPCSLLGLHPADPPATSTLRTIQPGAEQVYVRFDRQPGLSWEMLRVDPEGLFETPVDVGAGESYRLFVKSPAGAPQTILDPYTFVECAVTPFDQHLFNSGNHYRIYDKLGAHCRTVNGIAGVGFAVWAPNAEGVSVVGPMNDWDGRCHQMTRLGGSGIWEMFIPAIGEGELYKFEIRARNGHIYLKADPYAFFTEVPPANASIVYEPQRRYRWDDEAWMERRQRSRTWEEPVSIYEVHLGSWARDPEHGGATYRDLADRLIDYVREMGFTHIELLPIAEHPFEPSWGYQVSNYYAPSARYGRPEDLMAFVDRCHQSGIGVIFDWVPGHFPKDAFALAWFDGTHLYEHADPRQGEHRDWGTLIFNYGRHEVENFLIANALFWLEHYHFDGLRVDAVASMLYLDYSRPKPGDWIPNKYGGRENLEAIEFLKHTNAVVHDRFPGVMMIAEESTSWPKVSRPTDEGGLGFGFKWNMGWMHDTLGYMSRPPLERRHHHNRLTFSIVYAFDENFILSLSHDEVVHLKGSLFTKMPGEDWERLANLRLLYAYMWAHPGKKLLFMGAEFGQRGEWNHAGTLEWELLRTAGHRQLKAYLAALNDLYRRERALFEADFRGAGFEWLDVNNAEENVVSFVRKAKDPRNALVFAFNFSGVSRPDHRLGIPYPVAHTILLDSNDAEFGGFGHSRDARSLQPEEFGVGRQAFSLRVNLPALSAIVLRPDPPSAATTKEFLPPPLMPGARSLT